MQDPEPDPAGPDEETTDDRGARAGQPLGKTSVAETMDASGTLDPQGVRADPAPGPTRPTPDEPKVGDLLGDRYELRARLGQGAFGTVFRAHDRIADHEVAIKLLSDQSRHSKDVIARLRRELHAALKVTHAGVVRTHDLLELKGRLALSMEYVAGETLAERLQREGPLSLQDLLRLAKDLTRALAAAHRAGVVHRDLKPANIIVRADNGRPVITDFGVSRLQHGPQEAPQSGGPGRQIERTAEGQIVGTPLYMAPEQMQGADASPAGDVYALGLVLYEAAAGCRPHTARTFAGLAVARRQGDTKPIGALRPEVPEWLCHVIARCLDPDPAVRFASAVELRGELDTLTSETGERPVPLLPPLPPPRPRWRRALAGLAGAGILATIVAGIFWQRGRLPSQDRRLAVRVIGLEATDTSWAGRVLTRLVTARLRDREWRLRVVNHEAANVDVSLSFHLDSDGLRVQGGIGPAGGRARALTPVRAVSLVAAAEVVAQQISEVAATGQPVRAPDRAERAAMDHLGTRSLEAYARYERAIGAFFASVTTDLQACERHLEDALRHDPGWPHAFALLATVQGHGSPRGQAMLARASREIKDATRDPVGQRLLSAIAATAAGRGAEAAQRLEELVREHPDDLLAGWLLLLELDGQRRTEAAISIVQRMHEQRPELQFGADLQRLLRDGGRAGEAAAIQARWLERAPEAEQALVTQVAADLDERRLDAAERHVRDLLVVHGEAPYRLATQADVLILAGRLHDAAAIAAKLLRGDQIDRARGHRRLGDIALLEGRFAAALDAFEQAAAEGRQFGNDGEVVQSLESLRSLASWMGDEKAADTHARAQEEIFRSMGALGSAATVAFERALARGPCPSLDHALDGIPRGVAERIARRDILRAAATRPGCGSCAAVVAAGLSPEERSTRSLYHFGLCAIAEDALPLALGALQRIERIRPASVDAGGSVQSSFFAILARYQLGRALERLGRKAEAKAAYADFLGHWGKADRVVKEVEQARAAHAAL